MLTLILIGEERGCFWPSYSLVGVQTSISKTLKQEDQQPRQQRVLTLGWWGGCCNSVSHQDSTLTHLLASLTTAVIKNEGLGSHFGRVPICIIPGAAGTELELEDKGIWSGENNPTCYSSVDMLCKGCANKIMCAAHFLLKLLLTAKKIT